MLKNTIKLEVQPKEYICA